MTAHNLFMLYTVSLVFISLEIFLNLSKYVYHGIVNQEIEWSCSVSVLSLFCFLVNIFKNKFQ